MSDHPDALEVLAAEYALGCLDPTEMRMLTERASQDAAFAEAIAAWERRLAPLAALVPPVAPPPGLWARLEQAIAPAPEMAAAPARDERPGGLWRSVRFWRATTAGALALAAAFAGLALLRPAAPIYVATLGPAGGPAPTFLAEARPDGSLVLRPLTAVQVAATSDLELWALPPGATKPVSLGVIPRTGVPRLTVPRIAAASTQLMVSLEPAGGSPTGQPTGPVLYAGTLRGLE